MTRVAHCVEAEVGHDGMQRCVRCGVALVDSRRGSILPAGRVFQPVSDSSVPETAIRDRSGFVPCAILN